MNLPSVDQSKRTALVKGVFNRCVDARLDFNAALMRCALKGSPDKKAAIYTACRIQELALKRLAVRLNYLVAHQPSTTDWNSYTTTALVHRRVQRDWKEHEAALASGL